jgi:hypothetical protein
MDEPWHDRCARDDSHSEHGESTGGEGDDGDQTGQGREKVENRADRKPERGCGGRRRRGLAERRGECRIFDAEFLLDGREDRLFVGGQRLLLR